MGMDADAQSGVRVNCEFCRATFRAQPTQREAICPTCGAKHINWFDFLRPKDDGTDAPIIVEVSNAVEHPKHYNAHPSGVECINIVRHMNFNLGNVVKYIFRADHKGATIEDLKKAAFYLNDEIKRLEKQNDG